MILPLPPTDQLERAYEKASILRDFENSNLSKEEFIRERGLNRGTFYRDLKRKQTEGIRGLIDRRSQRPKTGIKLDDKFSQSILLFLVLHPKAPLTVLHEKLIEEAKEKNWGEPPTYDKVWRFVKSISADVLLQWSDGNKERIEQAALTVRRTVGTINELWQTDFSEMPLWTYIPGPNRQYFKPWLIGTICAKGRGVPAARVCQTVNAGEILMTWRTAMFAKKNNWNPFYGVPTRMSMDNHKVFKGDALQSLHLLGVEPHFIHNDSPNENGKQERWFQTVQTRLIKTLPGFSDQYKGLEKAKQDAIPYPLLQGMIDDYLTDYHLTDHSELGMTPWEAWYKGMGEACGLLVSDAEVDRCLRVSREVLVTREGVEINKRHFTGPFLEGRVDDTLTARVQPDEIRGVVPIYDHGLHLGDAVEEVDGEIARLISEGRTARTIGNAELKAAILARKEAADKAAVPTPTPEPPEKPPIEVPALGTVDVKLDGLLDNLGHIPTLPVSEKQ
jgi:hypothetical protein